MNIENKLANLIQTSLLECFEIEEHPILLQPTKKDFVGHFTFVIFPYVKSLKKSPQEIGKVIGEYLLKNTDIVLSFNLVQGFLNIELTDKILLESFSELLTDPTHGKLAAKNSTIMVEYSSPNTNKPLHLGHLRNNFLGFSVAQILVAAGYNVVKTNLVNDRGIHICKSMLAYQKFGENETPTTIGLKGDHLVGKYYVIFDKYYKTEIQELIAQGLPEEEAKKQAPILLEAQDMLLKWEQNDTQTIALWNKMNDWVFDGFATTYQNMGVSFDKTYRESNTYLLGKEIIEDGLSNGVFYKKEDGSVWIDLTDQNLDQKLVLRKDGTSVYITQDLGTAELKYLDFGMDKSIYVVGNEQDYHFEVLFKIIEKLKRPYAKGNYHLSYGMVDLPSGKMKSREGTVVDADDLMQEMVNTAKQRTLELGKIEGFAKDEAEKLYQTLAMGALKYFLLKVDPKKRMLFNPEESIDFQGNTGPFIQYTHARICSILKKAEQLGEEKQFSSSIALNNTEKETILLLLEFNQKIEMAAQSYSPALIAQYAFDLAKTYNRFYNEVSILNENDFQVKQFRLLFSGLVAKTLNIAMKMLGIEVPNRM